MGRIQSSSKSVEALNFQSILDGKVIRGQMVTFGGTILIKSARGTLYTNCKPASSQGYCGGVWEWSDDMTKCLYALKLMTRRDKLKHSLWIEKCLARDKAVADLGNAMRVIHVPALNTKENRKTVMEMWDALDWQGQETAYRYGYMPEGAVMKEHA